jgi:putative ABC transport system permease protein
LNRLTQLGEGIQIALEAIFANKLRAGLTILGVAIGVGVVVSIAAMISGIRASVLEAFESAGPENFVVMPFDPSAIRITAGRSRPPWWDNPEISNNEVARVARLSGVSEAIISLDFEADFFIGSERVDGVRTTGTRPSWPAYTIGDFVGGRNFTLGETTHARTVVVISRPLADELFGALDPVGREVRVSSGFRGVTERFKIVGVYDVADNIFGQASPYYAIMPYPAAERRLKAKNPFVFPVLQVVPRDDVPLDDVKDQVISALRSMRGLGPAEGNDFALVESGQILELFNRLTGIFFLIMLALSSAGLMVGGVGVIGIMLISVTERTREIGVRKAVGATRNEILWQFLVEAAVLTVLGASLGLLMGWGLSSGLAAFTPIPAQIPFWSVITSLAMAALTGMLFGLLPAIRASRLEPVAALRFE